MLARLHKVKDNTAKETEQAISKSIESLPAELFKSITWDNGKEGVCHTKIRDGYNLKTYFCDPYSSWQKGGVENLNGLFENTCQEILIWIRLPMKTSTQPKRSLIIVPEKNSATSPQTRLWRRLQIN